MDWEPIYCIMNIVDDYTNFPWSIPLKFKSDAFAQLQIWERTRENETALHVGTYQTDNGELKSKDMKEWLMERGVDHQYMAPNTSTHIGKVEHMHRTLMSKSKTMCIYANLPLFLWDKLYLTALHLHAKTMTHSLNGRTPWELWHGRKPDYSYMHGIGCCTFILVLNKHNPKIYEWYIQWVLIGYDAKSESYHCYNWGMKQVYSSYHVCFLESHDCVPPSGTVTSTGILNDESKKEPVTDKTTFVPICIDPDLMDDQTTPVTQSFPNVVFEDNLNIPPRPDGSSICRSTQIHHNNPNTPTRLECAVQDSKDSAAHLKAHKEEWKKTLQDLHVSAPPLNPSIVDKATQMALHDTNSFFAALAKFIELNTSTFECTDEPRTWEEALQLVDCEIWRSGYIDELNSLKEMGVYILVPQSEVPQGDKIQKGHPIFRIKKRQKWCRCSMEGSTSVQSLWTNIWERL